MTRRFEQALADYLGRQYAWGASTGTLALAHGLRLLGVGVDDEVIIPTYTCSDVLSAVRQTGAAAVLVDASLDDFNLDVKQINERITAQTKAIIVCHQFGLPVVMDKVTQCRIPVVEDCAHALGADYHGQRVGSLGDLTVCSFHGLKMLTTGEGGMVLADCDDLARVQHRFSNPDFTAGEYALDLHLSNVLAAIGLDQLQSFDERLERRRAIAARYQSDLSGIPGVRLPTWQNDQRRSSCFRYALLLDQPWDFDGAEREFARRGIVVRRPVKTLNHRLLGLAPSGFPVAEALIDQVVSIPLYPDLSDQEVTAVIDATWSIFG